MNDKALQTLYGLAQGDGYTKSFDDFKQLMSTNEKALNTMYGLAQGDGYTKDLNSFKTLVGFGGIETEPLKKKEDTDLSLEDGSSESQDYEGMPFLSDMFKRQDEFAFQRDPNVDRRLVDGAGVVDELEKVRTDRPIRFTDEIIEATKDVESLPAEDYVVGQMGIRYAEFPNVYENTTIEEKIKLKSVPDDVMRTYDNLLKEKKGFADREKDYQMMMKAGVPVEKDPRIKEIQDSINKIVQDYSLDADRSSIEFTTQDEMLMKDIEGMQQDIDAESVDFFDETIDRYDEDFLSSGVNNVASKLKSDLEIHGFTIEEGRQVSDRPLGSQLERTVKITAPNGTIGEFKLEERGEDRTAMLEFIKNNKPQVDMAQNKFKNLKDEEELKERMAYLNKINVQLRREYNNHKKVKEVFDKNLAEYELKSDAYKKSPEGIRHLENLKIMNRRIKESDKTLAQAENMYKRERAERYQAMGRLFSYTHDKDRGSYLGSLWDSLTRKAIGATFAQGGRYGVNFINNIRRATGTEPEWEKEWMENMDIEDELNIQLTNKYLKEVLGISAKWDEVKKDVSKYWTGGNKEELREDIKNYIREQFELKSNTGKALPWEVGTMLLPGEEKNQQMKAADEMVQKLQEDEGAYDKVKGIFDDMSSYGKGGSSSEAFTEAWKERSMWGKVLNGVAESIPSMIFFRKAAPGSSLWTKGAVIAGSSLPTLLHTSSYVTDAMDNNPAFDNVSENERQAVSFSIGLPVALLERAGFVRGFLDQNPWLANWVAKTAIQRGGANITAKTFKANVIDVIESPILKKLAVAGTATLTEAETGLFQEMVDMGVKQVYDAAKGADMFNEERFGESWSGTGEWALRAAKGAFYEGMGGLVMGSVPAIATKVNTQDFSNIDPAQWEVFKMIKDDPKIMELSDQDFVDKVVSGEMTSREALQIKNNYKEAVNALNQIDDINQYTEEQQKDALGLVLRLNELNSRIKGKNKELSTRDIKEREEVRKNLAFISENAGSPDYTLSKVDQDLVPLNNDGQVDDDVEIELKAEKIEDIPEQYRDRAEENNAGFMGEVSIHNNVAGLPIGQRTRQRGGTYYTYKLTGKEINNAIQKQSTINMDAAQSTEAIQEVEEGASATGPEVTAEQVVETPKETTITEEQSTQLNDLGFTPEMQNLMTDEDIQTSLEFNNKEEASPMLENYTAQLEEMQSLKKEGVEGEVVGVEGEVVVNNKKNETLTPTGIRVMKAARKALRSVKKILPKLKIIAHATPEEFHAAIGQEMNADNRGQRGEIKLSKDGSTIHLNMQFADTTTIFHEVFHDLIYQKFGIKDMTIQELVSKDLINKIMKVIKRGEFTIKGQDMYDYLEDYVENYKDENVHDEEKLSEIFGALSTQYNVLAPKVRTAIQNFIKKIAKALNIKMPETFTKDDLAVVNMLNTLAFKLRTGEVIQEEDIDIKDQTKTREELDAERKELEEEREEAKKKEERKRKEAEGKKKPTKEGTIQTTVTQDGKEVTLVDDEVIEYYDNRIKEAEEGLDTETDETFKKFLEDDLKLLRKERKEFADKLEKETTTEEAPEAEVVEEAPAAEVVEEAPATEPLKLKKESAGYYVAEGIVKGHKVRYEVSTIEGRGFSYDIYIDDARVFGDGWYGLRLKDIKEGMMKDIDSAFDEKFGKDYQGKAAPAETTTEEGVDEEVYYKDAPINQGELTLEGVGDGYQVFFGESILGDTQDSKLGLREDVINGKKVYSIVAKTFDKVGRPATYSISLSYPENSNFTQDEVNKINARLTEINEGMIESSMGERQVLLNLGIRKTDGTKGEIRSKPNTYMRFLLDKNIVTREGFKTRKDTPSRKQVAADGSVAPMEINQEFTKLSPTQKRKQLAGRYSDLSHELSRDLLRAEGLYNDADRYERLSKSKNPADRKLFEEKYQQNPPKTKKQIFADTHWYRGIDGKYRYEIPDGKLVEGSYKNFTREGADPNIREARLDEIYIAPELYKAYPELGDIMVQFTPIIEGKDGKLVKDNLTKGDWDGQIIRINTNYRGFINIKDLLPNKKISKQKEFIEDVLVHEVQHAIQDIEGFAKGTAPDYAKQEIFSQDEYKSLGKQYYKLKLRFDLLNAIEQLGILLDKAGRPELRQRLEKSKRKPNTFLTLFKFLNPPVKKKKAGRPPAPSPSKVLLINLKDSVKKYMEIVEDRKIQTVTDSMLAKYLNEVADSQINEANLLSQIKKLKERNESYLEMYDDYDMYARSYGEMEARNVQERRRLKKKLAGYKAEMNRIQMLGKKEKAINDTFISQMYDYIVDGNPSYKENSYEDFKRGLLEDSFVKDLYNLFNEIDPEYKNKLSLEKFQKNIESGFNIKEKVQALQKKLYEELPTVTEDNLGLVEGDIGVALPIEQQGPYIIKPPLGRGYGRRKQVESTRKQLPAREAGMEDVILWGRSRNLTDNKIQALLLERKLGTRDEIKEALRNVVEVTAMPEELANIEGGVQAGEQMFEDVMTEFYRQTMETKEVVEDSASRTNKALEIMRNDEGTYGKETKDKGVFKKNGKSITIYKTKAKKGVELITVTEIIGEPARAMKNVFTKSIGQRREILLDLLEKNKIYKKQSEFVKAMVAVVMDKTLNTRANQDIETEIRAAKRLVRAAKKETKLEQEARNRVEKLIRENLPKKMVSEKNLTKLKKLLKSVRDTTDTNALAKAEQALKIIEEITQNEIKAVKKDIESSKGIIARKANPKSGVDGITNLYFQSLKKVLTIYTTHEGDALTEALDKFEQQLEEKNIDGILRKLSNKEDLTLKERSVLYDNNAYELMRDYDTMTLEEVRDLHNEIKLLKKEGIEKYKSIREVRRKELEKLDEEVTAQIKENQSFLLDEDGNIVDPNNMAMVKAARDDYRKGNLYSEMKQYFRDLMESKGLKNTVLFGWMYNLPNILSRLDNIPKGQDFFTRYIYDKLKMAEERYLSGDQRQRQIFNEMLMTIPAIKEKTNSVKAPYAVFMGMLLENNETAVNKKGKDLRFKDAYGNTITLSKNEALRVYALSKNEIQRARLLNGKLRENEIQEGNGYSEKILQDIETYLGEDLIKVADLTVNYLSNNYFEGINKVYQQSNNSALQQTPNYFPTKTVQNDLSAKEVVEGDFNFGKNFTAEYMSALKRRSAVKGPIDINKTDNFTSTVDNHFENMERFKAYALDVKTIRDIFRFKSVDALMKVTELDNIVNTQLNSNINPNFVINNKTLKSRTWVGKVQSLFVTYVLAQKPLQILGQASSFIAAWSSHKTKYKGLTAVDREVVALASFSLGTMEAIAGLGIDLAIASGVVKKSKWIDYSTVSKAYEISGTFRNRIKQGKEFDLWGLESGAKVRKNLDEDRYPKLKKYKGVGRLVRAVAGSGTLIGDVLGVMGYMINYKANKRLGMSESEALLEFNKYEQTQQTRSSLEKNMLQLEGNDITRQLTMFNSTFFLQINRLSMSADNILKGMKKGNKVRATDVRDFYTQLFVANAMYVLAKNIFRLTEGDDEDRKDIWLQIQRAAMGMNQLKSIPIVGLAIEQAEFMYDDKPYTATSTNPVRQMVYDGIKMYQDEEKSRTEKLLTFVQQITELRVGVRIDPVVAFYKYFFEGDEIYEDQYFYDMINAPKSLRPNAEGRKKAKEMYESLVPVLGEKDAKIYVDEVMKIRKENEEEMRNKD